MPPSSACSQLHSSMTLETCRRLSSHLRPGEFRRRRHLVDRAEIGPHQPAQFDGRIGGEVDVLLELVLRRLVELIDAVAFDVEFPAVIDAAQPAFLVAPEKQRHPAVRAEFIHQPDPTFGVAEATRSSPSNLTRTGGQSGSAISHDRQAGIQ